MSGIVKLQTGGGGNVLLQAASTASDVTVTVPAGNVTLATSVDVSTAINAGLGYGQTWQDVTGSRSKTTTYTNSTGKPIVISILYTASSGTIDITVGGVMCAKSGGASGAFTVQAIIPVGSTYSFAGVPTVNTVLELR